MRKADVVEIIADNAQLDAAITEQVLDAFINFLGIELKTQGCFTLRGLGTFKVNQRSKYVIPKTGETIIRPKKYVSFSQSEHLNKLLNTAKKWRAAAVANTAVSFEIFHTF